MAGASQALRVTFAAQHEPSGPTPAAAPQRGVMQSLQPVFSSPCCEISETAHYLRCRVGRGHASEIQECYRRLAAECLQRPGKSALVLGDGGDDCFLHLAWRDALRAVAVAGLAPNTRLAFVALTPDMIAIYDAAVVEALRLGMQARRFRNEEEATRWLTA